MPQDNRSKLLLADDNENFCWALERAFTQRGYEVRVAHSVPAALTLLEGWTPDFAVVDLRMPGPSGLSLIPRLREIACEMRVVVLTGYASVATAVEAIKLGATHYLMKPVDADAIESAFRRVDGDDSVAPVEHELSVDRLEWEHIQRVYAENGHNISATARALGMHRRTLQRKLGKHPVRR